MLDLFVIIVSRDSSVQEDVYVPAGTTAEAVWRETLRNVCHLPGQVTSLAAATSSLPADFQIYSGRSFFFLTPPFLVYRHPTENDVSVLWVTLTTSSIHLALKWDPFPIKQYTT